MLNIRKYALGPVQTNCYVIANKLQECLIVDPGEEGAKLIKNIKQAKLKPLAILLTHAHFDHIGAVDEVREAFDIPVYMHKKEQQWLSNPNLNGSAKYAQLPNYKIAPANQFLTPSKAFQIGSFTFDIAHTPGHSPGSISFLFLEDRIAFVGDTLFKGSIGRTDLIEGNERLLLNSIKETFLGLPNDTIIYPGHDEATTVEDEKRMNPFLQGLL